jgi:hypothetical protein
VREVRDNFRRGAYLVENRMGLRITAHAPGQLLTIVAFPSPYFRIRSYS